MEGYQWSSSLWRDSFDVNLPASMLDDSTAALAYERPVRIVKLDKGAAPLVKGASSDMTRPRTLTGCLLPMQIGSPQSLAAPKETLMDQAIEGRELITLDGDGVFLRGTFHRPRARVPIQSQRWTRNRIGVVFFNSLSLPRAATGDSAVYWAESFANCGYPSFRFDLPGLGDTAGDIPLELLNFINAGGYASITAAKVESWWSVSGFQV